MVDASLASSFSTAFTKLKGKGASEFRIIESAMVAFNCAIKGFATGCNTVT